MLRRLLERALSAFGWQQDPANKPAFNVGARLPADAESRLRPSHPRLLELRRRYSQFDRKVTTPLVWKDGYVRAEDLLYFRGDNAYVWQLRGPNMDLSGYALATYYVKSIDALGLLSKLAEDDYFGNFVFDIDHKVVSRDLLDSILEIYFLDRHLDLKGSNVLDIGAGYGRLAHRMLGALPEVMRYLCTDAVPESTFVCEYYVGFRNLGERARVIPLDEIESTLGQQPIDVAVNIHSFSECTLSAVEWWSSLLARQGVKHLMIVPNGLHHGGELLLNNAGEDMRPAIERPGYRQVAKDPKYGDAAVQKYAINPTCHYLFALIAGGKPPRSG